VLVKLYILEWLDLLGSSNAWVDRGCWKLLPPGRECLFGILKYVRRVQLADLAPGLPTPTFLENVSLQIKSLLGWTMGSWSWSRRNGLIILTLGAVWNGMRNLNRARCSKEKCLSPTVARSTPTRPAAWNHARG